MISVIVPFFNAEKTLERCVDSILGQTYSQLEVLLVDDGSTDQSGIIAEKYKTDSRVTVFHKKNDGLSSARNYGLDRANGDYIAFVDADDWIEKNTFALARTYDAEICIFGYVVEYPGKEIKKSAVTEATILNREEVIHRLIVDGSIVNVAWDKLYKSSLFKNVRYPEGYNYEDIRTTYKLFQKANNIVAIPDILYHYVQYKESISHKRTPKNKLDRWTAYYEQYCVFQGKGEDYRDACIRRCNNAVITAWSSLWKTNAHIRKEEKTRIEEIISFAKIHKNDPKRFYLKVGVLLASTGKRWSMFCEYLLIRVYSILYWKRTFQK